jgi:hypothetical protein
MKNMRILNLTDDSAINPPKPLASKSVHGSDKMTLERLSIEPNRKTGTMPGVSNRKDKRQADGIK